MASSSKKKTTFAKITRENKVREKRMRKQARKDERKRAAAAPAEEQTETPAVEDGDVVSSPAGPAAID